MEPVDTEKKKTSALDLTPHFCTVAVSRPESTAATIEKSHSGCFPTSATPGEAPISEGQHKRRLGSVLEQSEKKKGTHGQLQLAKK